MLRTLTSLALAVLLPSLCPAQNCANTSVGFTPLEELGAGSYQGFPGGLYPGGASKPPLGHAIDGLRAATQVVPRDAQGQPDPAGKIAVLSIGMSNAAIHWNQFIQLGSADPLRRACVQLVQGAQGGIPAEDMDDPGDPYWLQVIPQKLAAAGASAQQVQVLWMLQANRMPTGAFPAHAQTLRDQMASILRIARDTFPNARVAYLANRIYAGYATTSLNPEPYAYEQGFAIRWLIESQIGGDPTLNFDPAKGPVEAPWLAWGPYTWADGLVPNSKGLTWVCGDFNPDGTHPSTQGAQKNVGFLLDFMHAEPTALTWYLAQPPPLVYGLAKPNSLGGLPAISWSGQPSLSTQDLIVRLDGALPHVVTIAYHGGQPALVPFAGGALLTQPVLRLPPKLTSPSGSAAYAVPMNPLKVGNHDHFAFWFRDPLQPDGTGTGLSDGLRVLYQP